MAAEGIRSPKISMNPRKRTPPSAETGTKENILSPGFRSVAAMAGWDEEALLLASLVVEDTPVRESRRKKRPIQFKSPPSTNSTRKRISHRPTPDAIPPIVLHLDDDADVDEVAVKKEIRNKIENVEGGGVDEEKKVQREGASDEKAAGKGLACMDRLREELSCAICLDICFEPSTTPCGHSFCMKCLKCAAAKCGKRCPKCRQLISIGRACTVNTVLWNTIQLLFPEEVEEKKKAIPTNSCSRETGSKSSNTSDNIRIRRNDVRSAMRSSSSRSSTQAPRATDNYRTQAPRATDNYRSIRRSAGPPSQSEDAALALRLQREEFMEAFQDNREQQRNTVGGNLRSIASRAMYIRSRAR